MKTIRGLVVLLFVGMLFPMSILAADFGIGVNVIPGESYGYGFLVPIRVGSLMIEPEISFSDYNSDENNSGGATYSYDSSSFTIGTGLYLRRQILPSTESYFGARLGYASYDSSNTNTSGGTVNNYENEEDGLFIAPTVGIQYFFSEKFSIGLDVGLSYTNYDSDYTSRTNGVVNYTSSGSSDDWATISRFAVRGFF